MRKRTWWFCGTHVCYYYFSPTSPVYSCVWYEWQGSNDHHPCTFLLLSPFLWLVFGHYYMYMFGCCFSHGGWKVVVLKKSLKSQTTLFEVTRKIVVVCILFASKFESEPYVLFALETSILLLFSSSLTIPQCRTSKLKSHPNFQSYFSTLWQ